MANAKYMYTIRPKSVPDNNFYIKKNYAEAANISDVFEIAQNKCKELEKQFGIEYEVLEVFPYSE